MLHELLDIVFDIFYIALVAYVIMSWIPDLKNNKIFAKLDEIFSKILAPIRNAIPPIGGTFDISPIILFIALGLLKSILFKLI